MKVASRFLIPLEMFMGWSLLAWGVSGGIGHGTLHQHLLSTNQAYAWLLILSVTGLTQMGLAMFEWRKGRRWPIYRIYRVSGMRANAAFVGGMCWAGGFVVMLIGGGTAAVTSLTMIAPFAALMSAWCFTENLKVRVALDDSKPTSTLHFHR